MSILDNITDFGKDATNPRTITIGNSKFEFADVPVGIVSQMGYALGVGKLPNFPDDDKPIASAILSSRKSTGFATTQSGGMVVWWTAQNVFNVWTSGIDPNARTENIGNQTAKNVLILGGALLLLWRLTK
jgi:hypothetical protein